MSYNKLARFFLYLGATGFGGPVALANKMHEELVTRQKVLDSGDFRQAMTLAHLLPGPLAIQVAMYIGWKLAGFAGGTIAGICFVIPSFLITVGIAWIYVKWSGIHAIQSAFGGVSAAVASLVLWNSYRLSKGVLARDRLLWVIALASGSLTMFKAQEPAIMFLVAAILTAIVRGGPWAGGKLTGCLLPLAAGAGLAAAAWQFDWTGLAIAGEPMTTITSGFQVQAGAASGGSETLTNLFTFFLKSGAFIFGSGLVIIPFMREAVLHQYHWLNAREFLDAVAVGFMTPGPALITVAFIGYLVAGFAGAAVSSVGIFSPSWFFTLGTAPFYQKIVRYRAAQNAVDGISAAAVGAIGGAGLLIARDAVKNPLENPLSALIALIALAVLARAPKFPDVLLLAGAAAAGILAQR